MAGTDSHISFQLGKFDYVKEVLSEIQMPEKHIMNTDMTKFIDFISRKGNKNILDFKNLLEEQQ